MPQRCATVAVVLAIFALTSSAPMGAARVRMTAWAVNASGGTADTLEVGLNDWSAASERQQLIDALAKGGQSGLLRQLQHVSVKGRIWMPNRASLGWSVRYAWQEPTPEGGRRIVIATDRNITLWASHLSRRIDYPFSFFEIRLNADGQGEGKMAVATKLSVDRNKNLIMLEDYAAEPVRLLNIRVAKAS